MAVFASSASYGYTDNPSESCTAEFNSLVRGDMSVEYLTNNQMVRTSRDYSQVLSPLVKESIVNAHRFLQEAGEPAYIYPGLYLSNTNYKLNRYVRSGISSQVKGYYLATEFDILNRFSKFKFYYVYDYNNGEPKVRLLKVIYKFEDDSTYTTLNVCEGHSRTIENGKFTGSDSERRMIEIFDEINNFDWIDWSDLPSQYTRAPLNIREETLEGSARELFEFINNDSREHFEDFVSEMDESEQEYYLERFRDNHRYVYISEVHQIKDGDVVVGYIVILDDFAYSSIIEDGAWINLFISIEPDGTLKIVRRSDGTA